MSLNFATGNEHKVEEAQEILDVEVNQIKVDLEEIQAVKVDRVVKDKVRGAYNEVKRPLFVEDTAFYIEALDMFPGALISWLEDYIGNKKILKLLKGESRKAKAVAAIGYHDGEEIKVFKGAVEGRIADEVRKGSGFGFDFIFIPKGHRRTFSELGMEKKNQLSHRKKALEKLKRYLKS